VTLRMSARRMCSLIVRLARLGDICLTSVSLRCALPRQLPWNSFSRTTPLMARVVAHASFAVSRPVCNMFSPRRIILPFATALAACQSPSPPPRYALVSSVKELMAGVVEPAADVYWDAVGEIDDSTGTHQTAPATDAEWTAVRNGALTVAESGNLLMLPGHIGADTTEWLSLALKMTESARKAMQAADRRDTKAVFDTGAELYDTCVACHAKYALQLQRPNTKP
jgi:hypothetical protein